MQGIWNPLLHPPWSSNYTQNINTEMNYWPAEAANLPECHQPLFDMIGALRITGAETARIHYDAGGFTVHHNTDIWAKATPTGEGEKGSARYAFWPLAAGWLSSHAFSHYQYNLCEKFLAETAWPIIKDAAQFYLDVLTEDTDGSLIFVPSSSPENTFIHEDGAYCISKTATMTTAIIRETLTNAVACCDILNCDADFKAQAYSALERLPAYKIGSRGELLEWSEELPEHEPSHRHTSHLYPLYPGHEILPGTALADACSRTLQLRGDEGTGWALAWRICLHARLLESEKAFEFLKKQLRPANERQGGCYPNLFGAHPPFQIDSNFGACAGIAELLLCCRQVGKITLLPALPKALANGYVRGLRAKGGVTVSFWYEDGTIKCAELVLDKHLPAREFAVSRNGITEICTLKPGVVYPL